jgi:hypothetical protein
MCLIREITWVDDDDDDDGDDGMTNLLFLNACPHAA